MSQSIKDSFGVFNNFVVEKVKVLTDFVKGSKIEVPPLPFPLEDELKRLEIQKQELTAKVVATTITALISLGVTYFGVKWLLNAMDPTKKEREDSLKKAQTIVTSLGLTNIKLTEYELCIASNLVDPLTMTTDWEQIGGLQSTIDEIRETLINPFRHRDIFSGTKLVQAPKGILLYGPPGCGKTMIAKATAKATGARFLNLQLSSLVDKWYGESQKRAEAVFSLAQKLQPTIIFIDEIDSFLRERSSNDHEATAMMKTQFMSFWDGLVTDEKSMVVVMGATNRPEDVDAAILRRMPSMFHIGLPNVSQREQILNVILKDESVNESVNLNELAQKTEGWSGSDLKELCRSAAVYRVRDLINISNSNGDEEIPTGFGSLTSEDFAKAYQRLSQSKRVVNAGQLFAEFSGRM